MAERMLRRGLPRVKGGEPWPADLTVEVAEVAGAAEQTPSLPAASAIPVVESAQPDGTPSQVRESSVATAVGATASLALRRGLPRVAGGEPWPPVGGGVASAVAESTQPDKAPAVLAATASAVTAAPASAAPPAGASAPVATPLAVVPAGSTLRRGLPRSAGGDPWPPAGVVAAMPAAAVAPAVETPIAAAEAPVAAVADLVPVGADVSVPLPFTRTVWAGSAPRHAAGPEPESSRLRPTWTQAIAGLFAAAGLGLVAISGIFLVRAFLSLPFMQDFLTAYPGQYETAAAPGIPGWVGWQHFFNMFLMLLIIRSGLRVRTEKRPTVFWAPRGDAKGKISLTLWFHQSLDILWLVNGVIFVVLLFASGHWLRIVPTSWEVIPNALSALLQYVSFDWPTEDGWSNYNSLQLLAYFTTVFLAAPLAAITGFRMSGLWPKKAEGLSRAYPVEWARAVHFPVMLYFVAFIVVHVALVFLTGMQANLNHMFASTDVVSWVGFWVFIAALAVMAIGWIAARPLALAPIAKVFGNVSGR